MVRTSKDSILAAGTLFEDRYEIIALLGSGGFGDVYQARQVTTGQEVALKVLRFRPGGDQETLDSNRKTRFIREARLCAQLHHPNIVPLLESDELADGRVFAVFALLPGQDLADLLRDEGALSPKETAFLMGQVLDALAAAHKQGVVHRDLKPSNIMVTSTGVRRNATVLDFGIGAFVTEIQDAEVSRLTGTGEMIGTPQYAPPEQLQGGQPASQSDLYSWGLVFLECLTGKTVVTGKNMPEIVFAQLDNHPVPLPYMLADHPLGELLRGVLEKDLRNRSPSAAGVLRQLEACDLSMLAKAQSAACEADLAPTLEHRAVPKVDSDGLPSEDGSVTRPEMRRHQLTSVGCCLSVVGADDKVVELTALRSLKELCGDVAHRFDGLTAQQGRDSVLLCFGYPPRGDDTRRALDAALKLLAEVTGRHNWQGPEGVVPEIRLGVHTGFVVARRSPEPFDAGTLDVVGPAASVATQLAAAAPTSSILVSDATRQLLSDDYHFEARAPLDLLGVPRPFEVFNVTPRGSEPCP